MFTLLIFFFFWKQKESPTACNQYPLCLRRPELLCTGHRLCFEVSRPIYPFPDKYQQISIQISINISVPTIDTNRHTGRGCDPSFQPDGIKNRILTFLVTESVLKVLGKVEREVSTPNPKSVNQGPSFKCDTGRETARKLLNHMLSKLVSFIL